MSTSTEKVETGSSETTLIAFDSFWGNLDVLFRLRIVAVSRRQVVQQGFGVGRTLIFEFLIAHGRDGAGAVHADLRNARSRHRDGFRGFAVRARRWRRRRRRQSYFRGGLFLRLGQLDDLGRSRRRSGSTRRRWRALQLLQYPVFIEFPLRMKQHAQAGSAFRPTKGDIAADRWRAKKGRTVLVRSFGIAAFLRTLHWSAII